MAKIDTGAKRTSIDEKLSDFLRLESVGETSVTNAMGSQDRPLVKLVFQFKGKTYELEASVIDRGLLTFPMIVGRDFLTAYKEVTDHEFGTD